MSLTVTHSTAFPKSPTGYYVLHLETLMLKCSYSTEFYDFAWLAGNQRIYHANMQNSEIVTDDVNERIQYHVFEGNSHSIAFKINKSNDENETFTCRVAITTAIIQDSETLHSILGEFHIFPSN